MKKLCGLVLAVSLLPVALHAAEPGVTDTEITIGSSLALEGPAAFLGQEVNRGFTALINSANEKGGVNGRKIKLIALNDGYEPVNCVINTQKLINENKVFMLANYVGTPTAVKAMPVWIGAKVPATGFFTRADALRTPFNPYIINVRASYAKETEAFIDAVVKNLGVKKVAIFYQYDGFGEAVKKGAEAALKKHGLAPVALGSYERNTVKTEEGLEKVKAAAPEVVVMAGTYSPLAKFVKDAKAQGLAKTLFYTVSFVGPEELAKELNGNTNGLIVSQVMPPYAEKTLSVVSEYRAAMVKYFPKSPLSFGSLEGYVNGKIALEGLKRAGKDLTRAGYIAAIETIKERQLGTGLLFSYGAQDHEGSDNVYLTHYKNGNFLEIRNWGDLKK